MIFCRVCPTLHIKILPSRQAGFPVTVCIFFELSEISQSRAQDRDLLMVHRNKKLSNEKLQETNLRSASYQRRRVHFCYDFVHVVRVLGHLVTDRQILFQTMFVIIFLNISFFQTCVKATVFNV